MKKILVPVDYTKVAINAIEFALNLKLGEEKEYCFFHVFSGLLEMNEPLLSTVNTSKKDLVKSTLQEFVKKNISSGILEGSDYCYKVVEGNPVQEITKESVKYDLVVMGTRDKYDLFDKILGTISLGVSKKSSKPLLLVPNKAKFKDFQKILVASDYHLKNHDILETLREWNDPYKALIQFLHIRESKDDNFEVLSNEIVKDFFESKDEVNFAFEIVSKQADNTGESILRNAYQNNMDLIVIIPENQSFLSTLLFSSISKEMVLKSVIPILFLHQ